MDLKKLITPILIIILIAGLIAGWFYWFEWRPVEIRKSCFLEASEILKEDIFNKGTNLSDEAKENLKKNLENLDNSRLISLEDFNKYYQVCLLTHGMKSETILLNKINKGSQKQEIPEQPSPNHNPTYVEPTYIEVEKESSWLDDLKIKQQQKCQEKINEYNICMNEYNAKMADYNTCLSETNNPHSIKYGRYCHKPTKLCFKPSCAY